MRTLCQFHDTCPELYAVPVNPANWLMQLKISSLVIRRFDWQVACILRGEPETQRACKRQSQASEAGNVSMSASLKKNPRR